jgi:hypothetical protein
MAKNRDEQNSSFDTNIVATVDIADLATYEKTDMNESVIFRKDVISSTVTASGGSLTVDFENDGVDTKQFDLILANANSANVSITINNTVNGDSAKYIALTKLAANTVSFTNATDYTVEKNYVDTEADFVLYEVINKQNNLYVRAINILKSVDYTAGTLGAGAAVGSSVKWAQRGNVVHFFGAVEIAGTYTAGQTLVTMPATVTYPSELHTYVCALEANNVPAVRSTVMQLTTGGNLGLLNGTATDQGYIYYVTGTYLV